jgi:hypothetical protein
VHTAWLETVSSCGKVFWPPLQLGLTLKEIDAIVHQTVSVDTPLQFIYVKVIPKDSTVIPGIIGPLPNEGVVDDGKNSLMGYMDQIGSLEKRRLWQQFDKFQPHKNDVSGTHLVTEVSTLNIH